jgi:hypothetical protein
MQFNRGFQATKTVARGYDEGLRAYMLKVYNLMALALGLTGIVAFGASTSEPLMLAIYTTPLKWVVMLAPLGVVIYLSARLQHMSNQAAQAWFWGYAALMGLSLSYIFLAFTGVSVARVFFITAGSFAGLSLYGYTTKKDLTGMGSFLMMGLIGIIIAGLVNIFLQSSGLHFAISAIGVLVFAGLTAYDTQSIKESYYVYGGGAAGQKVAIMGALRLYLDFINLMVMLLQLFGDRR